MEIRDSHAVLTFDAYGDQPEARPSVEPAVQQVQFRCVCAETKEVECSAEVCLARGDRLFPLARARHSFAPWARIGASGPAS
jgi:hypothetical protein